MIHLFSIDPQSDTAKYKQIIGAIENALQTGEIAKGDQLPSINEVCVQYNLSRDTVVKSYSQLKERGIITSAHGKGYYISSAQVPQQHRVFLLFNELNEYKEILHKSILAELDSTTEIDTFFHNQNIGVFEHLIGQAVGKYTHYVIMPTFNKNLAKVQSIIDQLPIPKTLLIDRSLPTFLGSQIYQDFTYDALHTFTQEQHLIKLLIFGVQDSSLLAL